MSRLFMLLLMICIWLFQATAWADEESVPGGGLSGEQLFLACSGCHSIQEGYPHKVGPNLYGVPSSKAGTRSGFEYSDALRKAGEEAGLSWNKGTLIAWIMQTEGMVPGTRMLYYNTLDGVEVQRLVDYIWDKAVVEPEKR